MDSEGIFTFYSNNTIILATGKNYKEAKEEAKTVLNEMGITEFETCEITMLPNEEVTVSGEDAQKFNELLDMLDEVDDVQKVYHNANIEE